MVTPTAIVINSTWSGHFSVTKNVQYRSVIHNMLTDKILTRKGIALCSRKLEIYGPNFGWFISQS